MPAAKAIRVAVASNRELFFLLRQGLGVPILNDLLGLSGVIEQALDPELDPQARSMLQPMAVEASRELAKRTAFWRAACGLCGRMTWRDAMGLLDGRLARGRATPILEGIDPHERLGEDLLPTTLLAAAVAGTALPRGGKVHIRRSGLAVTEFEPVGPSACYRQEVLGPLTSGILPEGVGAISEIDDDSISLALALRSVASMNRMRLVVAVDDVRSGGSIRLHHAPIRRETTAFPDEPH